MPAQISLPFLSGGLVQYPLGTYNASGGCLQYQRYCHPRTPLDLI